jgi:hypothetical protein
MGVIADTGEHSHQQSGRTEKERECNIWLINRQFKTKQ